MSVYLWSASLRLGPKGAMYVKSHSAPTFSPTAAPPKYLIEHAIGALNSPLICENNVWVVGSDSGRYCSSDIGQAEYGCKGFSHCGTTKVLHQTCHHQKRLFRGVEIITLLDTYFLVLRGMMSQQYFKRK